MRSYRERRDRTGSVELQIVFLCWGGFVPTRYTHMVFYSNFISTSHSLVLVIIFLFLIEASSGRRKSSLNHHALVCHSSARPPWSQKPLHKDECLQTSRLSPAVPSPTLFTLTSLFGLSSEAY